jgi:hypothetical protein
MKRLRHAAFALAAIICWSNTAASAEKWSCDMEMSTNGKPYKQEYIVSGEKLSGPSGKALFQVVLNNSDTLFAFRRVWENYPKDQNPINGYLLIAKSTGVVTEFYDIGAHINFDLNPGQWVPPLVTLGHCSLEQP